MSNKKHKNKDWISRDTHFTGFIEDAFNNLLEYNADLLRIVSISQDEDGNSDIVIAPLKVDKESINALAFTIVDALDSFNFNLPEETDPLFQVSWTLNGTEFAKKSKDKYAEPRDYNILGVELKYDKENNDFIAPNGEHHSPLGDYGISSVGYLADDNGLPCLQELYNYVVEYKLDKLIRDPLTTIQSPLEEL